MDNNQIKMQFLKEKQLVLKFIVILIQQYQWPFIPSDQASQVLSINFQLPKILSSPRHTGDPPGPFFWVYGKRK